MFEQQDFEVVTAQNGFEAFETVKKAMYPDHHFDFVLLDLNMPISNGYEACEKILKLYDENSLFQSKKSHGSGKKASDNRGRYDICLSNLKPYVVALSSLIDESVMKKTKEKGFEKTYLCPLKSDTIKDEILVKLVERRKWITEQKQLQEYMHESIAIQNNEEDQFGSAKFSLMSKTTNLFSRMRQNSIINSIT